MKLTDSNTIKLHKKAAALSKSTGRDEQELYKELLKMEQSKEEMLSLKIDYERQGKGLDPKDKMYLSTLQDAINNDTLELDHQLNLFNQLQNQPQLLVKQAVKQAVLPTSKPSLVNYSDSDSD